MGAQARARIRPMRRDSHAQYGDRTYEGSQSEVPQSAWLGCRPVAIGPARYKPPTCQEARGADAAFKGAGVHSPHKGEETGGTPVSREETTLTPLSIRAPYPRPLIALSQRFRSRTGASVLPKTAGAYTRSRVSRVHACENSTAEIVRTSARMEVTTGSLLDPTS